MRPDEDFAMSWEVDTASQEAARRHRQCAQGRRRADPRHRPRSRGRGHLLARARRAAGRRRLRQGQAGQPRRLQRHHQGRGHRGDAAPARDRRAAGRCLSRPPRARLPRRLHALADPLAQAARARARPAACSRSRCASSATARPRSRGSRPQEYWSVGAKLNEKGKSFEARLYSVDGKVTDKLDVKTGDEAEALKRAIEAGSFAVALGRQEADQAQPLRAVHHLEPAAGCLLAPRLLALAHHADRPAALRGRHHHLYANRRSADGARRHRRGAPRHREGVRHRLPAADAAHLPDQGQERAGSARGHPPDRHVPAPGHGARRCRPAEALRPDLAAHAREPDAAGRDRAHHGRYRRRRARPRHRAARRRLGRHLPRLPRALWRRGQGRSRRGRRGRRQPRTAAARRRRHAGARRSADRAALHPAAAALHRSEPHQEDGRARHRPARRPMRRR